MQVKLVFAIEPAIGFDSYQQLRLTYTESGMSHRYTKMVPIDLLSHQSFLDILFEEALLQIKKRIREEAGEAISEKIGWTRLP